MDEAEAGQVIHSPLVNASIATVAISVILFFHLRTRGNRKQQLAKKHMHQITRLPSDITQQSGPDESKVSKPTHHITRLTKKEAAIHMWEVEEIWRARCRMTKTKGKLEKKIQDAWMKMMKKIESIKKKAEAKRANERRLTSRMEKPHPSRTLPWWRRCFCLCC
ncbi:hypothetical protein L1049_018791 [Liquidambar formosana]|uniref:Remorin C-terminal domain-containing protein n=1 Tax=Liquidambar formosana TaxID=63359 RepID=A0AAP0RBI2_LIQFO